MGKLFDDTMLGLLQAVEIARGTIPLQEVQGMPGKTFRVPEAQTTDLTDSNSERKTEEVATVGAGK